MLKGVQKPHYHKKTRNGTSIIQTEKASNKRIRRPSGVNIPDGFGGVTAPGLKSLALVENNSSICSDGSRKFVGPQQLLGKLGRNLGV